MTVIGDDPASLLRGTDLLKPPFVHPTGIGFGMPVALNDAAVSNLPR
jgi:hypothetical protein